MSTITSRGATPAQSHPGRRSDRVWRWIGHVVRGLLAVIVTLALVGYVYQALAEANDMRANLAPGQLVDVGGHRLHIQCLGTPGAAGPTVVLEAGLGETSVDWFRVQQALASSVRVCAYDRAGFGWSELGPEPRDATRIAAELHILLQRAGIAAPYVLAAHSFGGLYARVFAAQYPDEVVGIALIDSSHPDQWTRTADGQASFQMNQRLSQVFPVAARLGLPRVSGFFKIDPALPEAQQAQSRALVYRTQTADANRAELRVSVETMAQVRASGKLGRRPLGVLTAGDNAREHPVWGEFQTELAQLSANTVHRVQEHATHVSVLHDARDAVVTSEVIAQVVEAAHTGQPLTQ